MNENHTWTAKILTLFPEMFPGSLAHSLIGKALKKNLWILETYNLREFSDNKRKTIDGPTAGGGAGQILKADVLDKAIRYIKKDSSYSKDQWPIVALSPRGTLFNQTKALNFSKCKGITIICGRYEGFDQRFLNFHKIPELSLGDFILSGGEIAAQALIDSVVRLIPHVIGNQKSLEEESFSNFLLEYPQYTSPKIWNNLSIPSELLSGHHENIKRWRLNKSEEITKTRRPDLWKRYKSIGNY
tara:strand:+ start:51 stop:779 length:729 start_codon:yes stop_codon:yes gene_type:complete